MIKKDKIKKRIDELNSLIKKWNKEYYIDNVSSVDDSVFDDHIEELEKLEKLYPEYISKDSASKNVGAKASSSFSKIEHKTPMLSLNKSNNESELNHFFDQISKKIGKVKYSVEPKIDGLSISIIYKDGILFNATTRGDGFVGEEVTNNVLQIKSIPKEISIKETIIVRGEIYLPISEWKRINNERLLKDKIPFANPRNAASGTLRQIDSNKVRSRNLNSFMFQILDEDGENKYSTQEITHQNLSKLGFKTTRNLYISQDEKSIFSKTIEILDQRDEQDYEIDGVVIKVNETKFYNEIGNTSKFPKWAIAYKPPAEIKETKLINIIPTIGRTGRVTYVAELEPVELVGSIVQKATLHNYDYIYFLDLRIGDIVRVKKAGEIIPKVISVVKEKRNKNSNEIFKKITVCPHCGENLSSIDGEVDQYCINKICPSIIKESLIHFASRDAMNIEGLSEKQINKFIDLKLIKGIADIYKIKFDDLINLDGYQETSVKKLLVSIDNSKKEGLEKLLFGLGIRYIGKKTSKEIARKFQSIDKMINIPLEDLLLEKDLGEVKAFSIHSWFKDEKNINLINELKELGINTNSKFNNNIKDNFFKDKRIVITGSIEGINREDMKNYFENLGSKVLTSISSKTDYLIAGNKPSDNKIKNIESDKIINIRKKDEIEKILKEKQK